MVIINDEVVSLSFHVLAQLKGIEDNNKREHVAKYILRWLESDNGVDFKTLTKEDYTKLRTSAKKFTMPKEASDILKYSLKQWVDDIKESSNDTNTV